MADSKAFDLVIKLQQSKYWLAWLHWPKRNKNKAVVNKKIVKYFKHIVTRPVKELNNAFGIKL